MIEDKESIDMWINTCKNMPEALFVLSKKNNVDKILEMLKLFREATKKLETIIQMSKEERVTA